MSSELLSNLTKCEEKNEQEREIVETKNVEEKAENRKVKYTEAQGHCVKSMMFTIENILRKSTDESAT